jgi:PHD/YefM family antitoxin component YafN of YafNO toxin-antitoxin module
LVPLYVAEISQDHIRGSLGSFFILSTNLGMLLIYIAGSTFDYFTTPKVMLLLPLAFSMLFTYFPETPVYLLRYNKPEAAVTSLKFFRSIRRSDDLSQAASDDLQKMITKVNSDAARKRESNLNELSEMMQTKEKKNKFTTICFQGQSLRRKQSS